MNFKEKISFLTAKNPLADGIKAQADYALLRYLAFPKPKVSFQHILRQIFRKKQYSFSLKKPYSYLVSGRYTDIGDFQAIEECFSKRIYQQLTAIECKPDLILDIGAHIGMFCLLAAHHLPDVRIKCFEPDPQNFQILQKNLQNNEIVAECYNIALSNESCYKHLTGQTSVAKHLSDFNGIPVKVDKLSNLIDFSGTNSLLIKCDVEGEEFKILEDCLGLLPYNTFIFIEVHEGENSVVRLQETLRIYDFDVHVTTSYKGLAIDCVAVRGFEGTGNHIKKLLNNKANDSYELV